MPGPAARAVLGAPLTDREREVHALICGGLRTKAIAKELEVSPKTVETHRMKINQKLGTRSTREIILRRIVEIGEGSESWQARVESIVTLARRALVDDAPQAQAQG
jgi:DNA-binding CsgD family transcriptional regulator